MAEPVASMIVTLKDLEHAILGVTNGLIDAANAEDGLDSRQVGYALIALGIATAQLETARKYIRQAQHPPAASAPQAQPQT